MIIRFVFASQLFASFHGVFASSPVCGAESEDGASARFFVEPLEQEDAATSELSDLSFIQVSAIARMRSAKLGEDVVKTRLEAEVTAEFEAAPEAEPHFFKAAPAVDTNKKRSHSKAPPVPLDKIIEKGLPEHGKLSFSGGTAVLRDRSSATATAGVDTAAASESSAAVISRLESRVEAVEREHAHLQEAVDVSEKTSAEMSRLERRIESVELENTDLKRAAQTAMHANKTKKAHNEAIEHINDDAAHDNHEDNDDNDDDDSDLADLNATIQKSHDESARLEATMKDIRKTQQVNMPTAAHGAKHDHAQKEASGKADAPPTVFSALKIQSATDLASPTVLLGGLNFTGDPLATDGEKPLLNVSLVEGSGFSIAFTASWHQFHPYSRLLSLSNGNKDILRVSGFEDSDTLSFSVRRCQHDGHVCNHDASVKVKKSIVANVTDRYLCTVSPRGKMEVFKNGTIIGRLKPDGSYAVDQKGGQAVPSEETGLYMARRTWQQRKQGVPPFEGYIGDVCFWSREVSFDETVNCISDAN